MAARSSGPALAGIERHDAPGDQVFFGQERLHGDSSRRRLLRRSERVDRAVQHRNSMPRRRGAQIERHLNLIDWLQVCDLQE